MSPPKVVKESEEKALRRSGRRSVTRKRTTDRTAAEGKEFLERTWGRRKSALVSRKISERQKKIQKSEPKTKKAKTDDPEESDKATEEEAKDSTGSSSSEEKETKSVKTVETAATQTDKIEFKCVEVQTETETKPE